MTVTSSMLAIALYIEGQFSFESYQCPTECYSVQKKNLKITKFDP